MSKGVYFAVLERVELEEEHNCVKLSKTIYGLKKASHVWNETLTNSRAPFNFKYPNLILAYTSRLRMESVHFYLCMWKMC